MPDERYDWLCQHWKPPSTIPAYLSVVDIAGLVKGAHEGQVRHDLILHPQLLLMTGVVFSITGPWQCIFVQHQCL